MVEALDAFRRTHEVTMPLESRLFVKTSLIALVLTFLWGAVMAVREATGHPVDPIWAVEHAHLAFVGWLVNLVVGIALWMLPLARAAYPQTQGRYPRTLPYVAYACLNGGLVLRIVSEPYVAQSGVAASSLVAAAVLQVVAIVLFGAIAWVRTRPPSRPAAGVR